MQLYIRWLCVAIHSERYCVKLYNDNVKWQQMWFLTLKCILIIWQWLTLWWSSWHGTEIFLHCTSYIKSVFSWHPCFTEVGRLPHAWDQFQLYTWAWVQKSPYDASLQKISWWVSQKGCCIMQFCISAKSTSWPSYGFYLLSHLLLCIPLGSNYI